MILFWFLTIVKQLNFVTKKKSSLWLSFDLDDYKLELTLAIINQAFAIM